MCLFGGPFSKDYSILGLCAGSSDFGKLPDELFKVSGMKVWGLPRLGLGLIGFRVQGLGFRARGSKYPMIGYLGCGIHHWSTGTCGR